VSGVAVHQQTCVSSHTLVMWLSCEHQSSHRNRCWLPVMKLASHNSPLRPPSVTSPGSAGQQVDDLVELQKRHYATEHALVNMAGKREERYREHVMMCSKQGGKQAQTGTVSLRNLRTERPTITSYRDGAVTVTITIIASITIGVIITRISCI